MDICKILESDDYFYIPSNFTGLTKDSTDTVVRCAVELFKASNDKNKNIRYLKMASIIKEATIVKNVLVKDMISVAKKSFTNLKVSNDDVAKCSMLNKLFRDNYNDNKELVHIFKDWVENGIYSMGTLSAYLSWSIRNNLFNSVDLSTVVKDARGVLYFKDLVSLSTAEMTCSKCGKTYPIKMISLGKTYCIDCSNKDSTRRKRGIPVAKNVDDETIKLRTNIEASVSAYKNRDNEQSTLSVQKSRALINIEADIKTLIQNIECLEENLDSLSDSSEVLVVSNKIKEVEDKVAELKKKCISTEKSEITQEVI